MKAKKKSVLSDHVFNTIRERIVLWEYSPDHRFTEEELSAEFNISRSPIREALRMLVENGFVTKEHYRGYTVHQLDLEEIHELYDVRQALELFAVEWLAINGMADAIWTNLHAAWQAILRDLPQIITNFADEDESFHETLAKCTGNRTLVQHLRNINRRIHFVRMTDITTISRLRATCEQHLRILDFIKAGDVQCAREALTMNIEEGEENVEQAVKEALACSFQTLHRVERKASTHRAVS